MAQTGLVSTLKPSKNTHLMFDSLWGSVIYIETFYNNYGIHYLLNDTANVHLKQTTAFKGWVGSNSV